MRVLLVVDDAMVGARIRSGLRQDHFVVDWVRERGAAEAALESQSYAVVVVDLGLPGKEAFAVLEALHRRQKATPVVIISEHHGAALAARIRRAVRWHANRAERENTIIALPFSWG